MNPVEAPREQGFASVILRESEQPDPASTTDGAHCRARSIARRETGVLMDALRTAPRPGHRPGPAAPRQARRLGGDDRPDRPELAPQHPEKIESAPGLATTPEASGRVDAARERPCAFAPPEPAQDCHTLDPPLSGRPENPPQGLENVQSAPGNGWPANASASGGASAVSPTFPSPIVARRPNVRATLNGVAAC